MRQQQHMNTSIRLASPKDLGVIIAMTKNTVDKCYREWMGDEALDKCLKSDKLDNYLRKYLSDTWLLICNSKIVGYSICVENMIDFMLIDVNLQGHGLGTKLLTICEDMLFDSYSTISLENFKFNSKANTFLNANGWDPVNQYLDSRLNTHKLIFIKKSAITTGSRLVLNQ